MHSLCCHTCIQHIWYILAQLKNFSLRACLMIVLIRSIKDSKTFAREPVMLQRVSVHFRSITWNLYPLNVLCYENFEVSLLFGITSFSWVIMKRKQSECHICHFLSCQKQSTAFEPKQQKKPTIKMLWFCSKSTLGRMLN